MDSRNFFDGPTAPPFKRNQFGATFSGPIKKDTTFFLFSFEALRDRLNATDVSFFPDANARNGIGVSNAADGTPLTISVDPRVSDYLKFYPLPNDGLIGRGIGRRLTPESLPSNENFFTIRMDQKITSRDSFFAHYTFDDATSQSPQDTFLFKP